MIFFLELLTFVRLFLLLFIEHVSEAWVKRHITRLYKVLA